MTYTSKGIPTEFGANPKAVVSADVPHGLVTLAFHERDGRTCHSETMSVAAARRISRAMLEAADAITDAAEAALDEQMGKHAHVSARWLGEMGREQRSN